MTVYFLLAAYNEEKDLPKVLEGIENAEFDFDFKVLVVDDGSLDNTKNIALSYAERLSLEVVSHGSNAGLGAALKTGFTALNKKLASGDIVITLDSDGTHPLGTVKELAGKIRSGFDIAIASRYSGGREIGLSFHRSVFSRTVNLMMKALFGLKGVKDYTSGFRAFSGNIIKKAFTEYADNFISETGFTATPELLIKAGFLKANITEVPLILHYDLKSGASKLKVLRTIGRYFVLFWKLKMVETIVEPRRQ